MGLSLGDSEDDSTTTGTTPTSTPTPTPQSFDISGRLVRPGGDPVTTGQVLVLIAQGGVVVPDAEGSISAQVAGHPPAKVVYSQAGPRYPDDGLHDFMAVGEVSPDAADLGTVTVPESYPVELVVEDDDGNPVSGASVEYEHTRAGVTVGTGFNTDGDGRLREVPDGSLELAGDVSFVARKGDRRGSESLTVTGETGVRLTLS